MTAAVAAGALALGSFTPAYADQTVTVQGTAFPDPARAQLSFVGCEDLYRRADERLQPLVGRGPGAAPVGTRSLGFDLAGGNAVGALYLVDSMHATTTASVAVNAPGRASGVAYAGYQEPADAGTSLLWLGRSDLVTPGGAWQTVEATNRAYAWAKYDMTTRQRVADGPGAPATVPAFIGAHGGDGPGLYTIGFGCDGSPFSMDALRVGPAGSVTTYDVEGLRTSVTIAAQPLAGVRSGDRVSITGQLHTGTGGTVPHPTMILEQRELGSDRWTPVSVAEVGPAGARVTVTARTGTTYRWRFVDRPLAEGSTSVPLLIHVLPLLPTTPPDSEPSPTTPPSQAPSDPTQPPSDPTQPPSDPTQPPTTPSTPSETASVDPTEPGSGTPEPESPASPSSSTTSDPAPPEPSSSLLD